MGWGVLIELTLAHAYYAPAMPPVTLRPSDPKTFARDGFLLRQQGATVFVLAEDGATGLPDTVSLDLDVQSADVITVSAGGDWRSVPLIDLPVGTDSGDLSAAGPSREPQTAGRWRLARVSIGVISDTSRKLSVTFAAVESHWAYHVIGPGGGDVMIEDTQGKVEFRPLGRVDLPDGRSAHVLRSGDALPARARPGQRFSLSRPGPFGPRVLIPVLPAPQPLFATVPAPDGAGALIQSDIFVSIF